MNSIVKIRVFIAVWGLQVQPVRVVVLPVGVFLAVVQLLVLLTKRQKNKLSKYRWQRKYPFLKLTGIRQNLSLKSALPLALPMMTVTGFTPPWNVPDF